MMTDARMCGKSRIDILKISLTDEASLRASVLSADIVKVKYTGTKANRTAVEALGKMLSAAISEGVSNFQISSAYRTYSEQQKLVDNSVAKYQKNNPGWSRDRCLSATYQTVAPAGSSEHQTGLAFDITVPGVSFTGTEQQKWLHQHCAEYGFIVRFTAEKQKLTGFVRIDGLMGIGVAAFILYSGAMLVKDTINPLLGAAPDSDLVEHIEKKALSYPGVLGVHDLMIHDYGPGSRLVSFHLEMDAKDDVMHSHDVIDRIERDLLVEDGLIATIHFDPVVTGDPHADELKAFLQREVEELAPLANIHDLRIVPGPTHTNVIFDCAVPAEYMTDKQHRGVKLVNALRNAVQAKWPDHFCVIKLEPDYAPVHHE